MNGFNGDIFVEKEPWINPNSVKPQMSLPKMEMTRYFTFQGKNPFKFNIYGNPINWVSEEVKVTDDVGKIIFTQKNVERPDFWTPLAVKVVASKYFWGDFGRGIRESSVEQLIGRVSRFIERQAIKQNYFNEERAGILRDEFAAICLNQLAV